MSITTLVVHPDGAVCRTLSVIAPWWETPHCTTCTCTRPSPVVEHGRYVECGYCHKIGVVPDPGHEQEILDRFLSAWK